MTVKIQRLMGPSTTICWTPDYRGVHEIEVVSLVKENDLGELESKASHAEAIAEICRVNSLASDGWEMIEAALRQEQADEIT